MDDENFLAILSDTLSLPAGDIAYLNSFSSSSVLEA